ncbi:uncharacterized protein LOC130702425 [Daphnia carinata]|uniref:uncharacterized protein LOC130702425 n=1 Tax=Daphnia carinata TaxID=120202 RepID=UPI0025796068|nr:uncharacterized protein LOC130702425 [Daphnia carinata]
MCEEENNKLCGYLQHKGKKRLISMWRRWYCVLNGRLLLFYRSEADYLKLGKFHERLDLGLVYDVLPALGVENGIQISTHTGPHWLRTTDEKSCELWLQALQASIVLRRQGSTLRKSKTGSSDPHVNVQSPVSNRNRKAKSTMSDVLLTTEERETTDKKMGSPFSRFSLGFIPGHGKKYSTYDSNRSFFRVELSPNEEWDRKEKAEDDKKISETPKLRKKNVKQVRPLSESVSNFLLLNSKSSENVAETKIEPVKTVNKKKGLPSVPKLPTSFGVGKLLSHLQTPNSGSSSRRHSKSMNSLLEACNAVEHKQQKSVSQSNFDVNADATLFPKKDDILSKRNSDTIRVDCQDIVDDVVDKKDVVPDETDCKKGPEGSQQEDKVTVASSEQQSSACADGNEDPESLDDKKKGGKKTKDITRRKSGLAMLKQFFMSAKISMKRKGESVDKDKLCVNDRSRKSSNESAVASEKSSARTSLILESDQQQLTVKNDVITEEQKRQEHQSKEETHKKEQLVELIEREVAEVPVISVLQRHESRKSEGEKSVQEEAFVSENAYTYEATVIEIMEPQSPGLVQPEYFDPTPADPCQDIITVPIQSSRNSSELTLSLENEKPARKKSVISCGNVTKEDLEVEELKPFLPLKTKVKCPSPGYDIPRSSPISVPCFEEIERAVNPEDVIEYSCVAADDDPKAVEKPEEPEPSKKADELKPEAPEPSKKADELKPEESEPSMKADDSKPDVVAEDCNASQTSRKSVRKLTPLIQIFDQGSNPKAPDATSLRHSFSKTKAFEKRISFAQAETETVQEEVVQILPSDPFE